MDQPTPGSSNLRGTRLHSPSFSVQRGVYDEAGFISMDIYDMEGKRIETLFAGEQTEGQHLYQWTPHATAQGVYVYRIEQENRIRSGKLLLLR